MEKDLMKADLSFHIVPVGPDGYPAPDLASPPVKGQAGDIYLTQSSERTSYQEWIRAGSEWVQVGETWSPEDEVDRLKKERVDSVRDYFRKKIDGISRRVIESYPGIRLTELSPQLDQVFLGPDLVADFYELSVSIRLCSREEDDSPQMWRAVSYDDPAYEDKLRRYLDVRLKYTPEERLRYLRQEQVKLYFENRRKR